MAVFWLPFEECFWYFETITHCTCPTIGISMVAIGKQQRALYLLNNVPYRLNHAIHSSNYTENPHLSLSAHVLQLVHVWVRSVNNVGHFTWRTKYLLHCISHYIPYFFLKFHASHSLCMSYNWLQSVNDKGHFTGRTKYFFHCILSSIPWIFLKFHNYHSMPMPYNWYKFGCDHSITKGTLIGEQSTFSAASCLHFEASFWNFMPITHCACPIIGISLVVISQ